MFSFVVPSGEKEKSFENFYAAHTSALENKLDRNSLILALGGGMIGDLAGFVLCIVYAWYSLCAGSDNFISAR